MRDFYEEGYRAYWSGKSLDTNGISESEEDEWWAGWDDAALEDEEVDEEY